MPGRAPARPVFSLSSSPVTLALATLLASGAGAQSPCRNALEYGMNPSFQNWSSRAVVFADALTRVRRFDYFPSGTSAGDPAPLIPLGRGRLGEGWPDPARARAGEPFGAYVFGNMEGTLPDGRVQPYVLTWSGTGRAFLLGPYVTGERNRSANRVEVTIDPTRSDDAVLAVLWDARDPADPVRDVHLWLPGMEGSGALFWPPFLDKVERLNGGRGPHTWRTLDWTRVNDYGRALAEDGFVFELSGVITARSPSQGTRRGVCTEFQVAFCNATRTNLHLSLPHRTDALSEPDYVRFLVDQLRVIRDGAPGVPWVDGGRAFRGLDPGLTVTVELSNEIWNSGFPVQAWMRAEAARKGLTFHQQIASQIQILFDVADAVFSGSHAPRLRKYVGGHIADPSYLERVLAGLRPGTELDALGPAAYFSPRPPETDQWLAGFDGTSCPNCPTPEEVLAAARRTIADKLPPLLAHHRAIAAAYRNPDGSSPALELYEGGQAFLAGGKPWHAAAKRAQNLPGMFDAYVNELVPLLIANDVRLVNWYSFMADQDPPAPVDAFGHWNDMQETITLPMVEPYVDQGSPKAAVICLGPPLAPDCPRARTTHRIAGTNLDVYRSTQPVLGRVLRATVDLVPSGHASALVIGSLSPSSIPLPSGQTLLSGLAGAEFLPLRPGPLATWDVRIPRDPSLAGIVLSTQAVLLGGPELALSNALDLSFGRE